MNIKETIRSAAILVCMFSGLYVFGSVAFSGTAEHRFDAWSIGFAFLFSSPLFFIAHSCFRRRFDRVVLVLAFFASVVLWAVLFSVPRSLGLDSLFDPRHHTASSPLRNLPFVLGALMYSLLHLFGPVWAATWFFRAVVRFASLHVQTSTPNSRNA
jgi:hypothetical protein